MKRQPEEEEEQRENRLQSSAEDTAGRFLSDRSQARRDQILLTMAQCKPSGTETPCESSRKHRWPYARWWS